MKLRMITLLSLIFLTQACLLPSPPNEKVMIKIEAVSTSSIEAWKVNPVNFSPLLGNRRVNLRAPQSPNRNLLFVAVDDTVQVQFEDKIKQVYNQEKPIRLEDVTWWRFAPLMRGLYDQVLRIPHNQLNTASLTKAIIELERLGKPWDLFLLTHGIPNHITASSYQGFISYKDLESLPQLKNLKLVFSQGCFSETLARDWLELGAQETLSFEGWNRNFFFIDFFLKAFKETGSVFKAYESVNANIEELMENERLYDLLLAELNLSISEYLEISPSPIYDTRL